MTDPQMREIRALFDAAAGTGFSRDAILALAEARVAELIDRLPAEGWPVFTCATVNRRLSAMQAVANRPSKPFPRQQPNPRPEIERRPE